ncbi:hypothetical protein HID58_065394 [Brassica napus]|uniref:Replication factor A C-terminal domain-containing protein n=1 Tax=Brassica napus TaxID=3708 RepID=A0ABQ7ZCN3_BRANA|nr:hypothetical protein HID58_065394 [Brassica napus]
MFCNCLRLGSSPEIAYLVNEEVLTKAETMTIREMFAYIKQESAKALFAYMVTTDYVLRNSSRYIACSDCKTKATRGPSLMYPKCGNVNYLAKISVYDNNDQSSPFLVMHDVSRLGSMPQN